MEAFSFTMSNNHHTGDSNARTGGANNKIISKLSVRRYPVRYRRALQGYWVKALKRLLNKDEPNQADALTSKETAALMDAMKAEIKTIGSMKCREIVAEPVKKMLLHLKLDLRKVREKFGIVVKRKATFTVCDNEEVANEDSSFRTVAEITMKNR